MKLNRMVWAAVAVLALQGFATATRASDPDDRRRLDALENKMPRCGSASIASSTRPQRQNAPRRPSASRRNPPQAAERETPGHAPLIPGHPRARQRSFLLSTKPSRRHRRLELCCPTFRDQRFAIVPATRRRQSGIWDAGDSVSHSDAELGESVAHAWLQSGVQDRGSLYAQRHPNVYLTWTGRI